MKVLVICVGSRGDAEPFCALTAKLLQHGHSVEFFIQPELKYLLDPYTACSTIDKNEGDEESTTSSASLNIHELPFTQFDFYKFVGTPTHGADHPNPRVRFTGTVTDLIAGLVLPCWKMVLPVALGGGTGGQPQQEGGATTFKTTEAHEDSQASNGCCDIIVTSALARTLSFAVAAAAAREKQHPTIPVALVHLQPLLPTNLFPHYSNVDACVECICKLTSGGGSGDAAADDDDDNADAAKTNLDSYMELERYQYDFLQERLDAVYRDMGSSSSIMDSSPSFETTVDMLSGRTSLVGIFNCFSSDLIPNAALATGAAVESRTEIPSVYNIGALADAYVPKNFKPPDDDDDDLLQFIQTERPICVGYGSMPYSTLTVLLEALEQNGRKALLVGDALKLSDEKDNACNSPWMTENVRQVSALPYPWLLPHCQMMVCHGGAGVVHAALRAGIPVVISPLIGDQFFFAEYLTAKKLGSRAGSKLGETTKCELVEAISQASTHECIENAKDMGDRMRSAELGVDRMYRILLETSGQGSFQSSIQ